MLLRAAGGLVVLIVASHGANAHSRAIPLDTPQLNDSYHAAMANVLFIPSLRCWIAWPR